MQQFIAIAFDYIQMVLNWIEVSLGVKDLTLLILTFLAALPWAALQLLAAGYRARLGFKFHLAFFVFIGFSGVMIHAMLVYVTPYTWHFLVGGAAMIPLYRGLKWLSRRRIHRAVQKEIQARTATA